MKSLLLSLLIASTEALTLSAVRCAAPRATRITTTTHTTHTLRMSADEPVTPPTTTSEPPTPDTPVAAETVAPQNKGPSFFEPDGSIDFTKYSITLSIGGLWLIIKLLGAIGVIDVSD